MSDPPSNQFALALIPAEHAERVAAPLATCVNERPDHRMRYFHMLDQNEQAQAIAQLAASGMSENTIATATQLSVEQIRKILGDQRANREINMNSAEGKGRSG
jgi:hypothetical protein